eukprot:scaffold19245_cov199-Amphora_coffeaeformis.AAC.26
MMPLECTIEQRQQRRVGIGRTSRGGVRRPQPRYSPQIQAQQHEIPQTNTEYSRDNNNKNNTPQFNRPPLFSGPPPPHSYLSPRRTVMPQPQPQYESPARGRRMMGMAHNAPTMIEIAPGIKSPLRGAKETWHCVENDNYIVTTCIDCRLDICCIADASFVLCPACKVVSPSSSSSSLSGNATNADYDGGVGLGFTMQNLQEWQREILRQQRYSQQQRCHSLMDLH